MKPYDILIIVLCVGFGCKLQAKQEDDDYIAKQARMEAKSFLEHQLIGVTTDELPDQAKKVIANIALHLQWDVTKRELIELLRELYSAIKDVPGVRRQKIWQQLGTIFPQIVYQIDWVEGFVGDEAERKKIMSDEAVSFIEKLETYPGKTIEKMREKLQASVSKGRDAIIDQLDQFLKEGALPADLEAFVFRLKHGGV